MTTFAQLVSRVRQQLLGYCLNQESYAELAADMTAGATTFLVDSATVMNLSQGLIEIGDELILVKKYDRNSGTVTTMGGINGRGAEGTTAAAHTTEALVTASPAFPRARIKEAVNETVRAIYPHLVVFGSTELTRVSVQLEYELPEDCEDVWYVTGETVGPSKVWQPLPNWRFNSKASITDFPSGKSLQQLDAVAPGQKIRVVYAKQPTALTDESQDFTETGYSERLLDLVVYGTMKRLLPAVESARLQLRAVETNERSNVVPAGAAIKAAGMYASLYQERLEAERDRQFNETPNYQFFQGS